MTKLSADIYLIARAIFDEGLKDLLSKSKNGTCLGSEAKTLGVWQSRPCSDITGAAICEMSKRRVCGATGGMLPISPLKLDADSLKNIFPKALSIPFSDILTQGTTLFSNNGTGGILSSVGGAASNAASSLLNGASNVLGIGK